MATTSWGKRESARWRAKATGDGSEVVHRGYRATCSSRTGMRMLARGHATTAMGTRRLCTVRQSGGGSNWVDRETQWNVRRGLHQILQFPSQWPRRQVEAMRYLLSLFFFVPIWLRSNYAFCSRWSLSVIWQDNIDPDDMTYEELLELGEAVGTQSRGLTQEQISLLPVSKYKCGFFLRKKSRDERCVICQMEYERGGKRITLPCKHVYHASCGNRWLGINKELGLGHKEASFLRSNKGTTIPS